MAFGHQIVNSQRSTVNGGTRLEVLGSPTREERALVALAPRSSRELLTVDRRPLTSWVLGMPSTHERLQFSRTRTEAC